MGATSTILFAIFTFALSVQGTIKITNLRTNASLLEIDELKAFGTFPKELPTRIYLVVPSPSDACSPLRKLPENDNRYDSFDVRNFRQEQLGWICLLRSGGCLLHEKSRYSYAAGCNYIIFSEWTKFKRPYMEQINASFVSEADGKRLSQFEFPNRYHWEILPADESSSISKSWTTFEAALISAAIIALSIIAVGVVSGGELAYNVQIGLLCGFVVFCIALSPIRIVLHGEDLDNVYKKYYELEWLKF